MKIRYTFAASLAAAVLACANPVDTESPSSVTLTPETATAVLSSVTMGSVVTISDQGWKSSFGGSITVESDATVLYAMVFGGSGGAAPVSGVSVGSQALTKVKSISGSNALSLDVYRLVTPATGSGRAITVTAFPMATVLVADIGIDGDSGADMGGSVSVGFVQATAAAAKVAMKAYRIFIDSS